MYNTVCVEYNREWGYSFAVYTQNVEVRLTIVLKMYNRATRPYACYVLVAAQRQTVMVTPVHRAEIFQQESQYIVLISIL